MLSTFFANIKILPVIATALASMIVGSLWYSPLILGKIWIKEVGLRQEDINMHVGNLFGAMFINISLVLGINYFAYLLNITSLSSMLELSLILWSCFIASTLFSPVIWAKKSIHLYLIDAGHWLAIMTTISVVSSLF